jgi:hypothetical protein
MHSVLCTTLRKKKRLSYSGDRKRTCRVNHHLDISSSEELAVGGLDIVSQHLMLRKPLF